MVRQYFGALRSRIESQSAVLRVGILIAAVILFRFVQIAAGVVSESGEPAVTLLIGGPVIIAAIVILYTIGVILWSFIPIGGGDGTDTATDANTNTNSSE